MSPDNNYVAEQQALEEEKLKRFVSALSEQDKADIFDKGESHQIYSPAKRKRHGLKTWV